MYTRRSVTIIICHCAKFQFFFLKLRPAADSALSVLDSHPSTEKWLAPFENLYEGPSSPCSSAVVFPVVQLPLTFISSRLMPWLLQSSSFRLNC
jgi:hypothetical protein